MDAILEDSSLLKLAIIVGFIGLCSLFAVMFITEVPQKNITDINGSQIGTSVRITGHVNSVAYSENKTTFINLSQQCSITVIGFRKIILDNDSVITVTGKVSEYDGKLEIIADKVQPIESID